MQFGCCNDFFSDRDLEVFEAFLQQIVNKLGIDLILEEVSDEGKNYFCESIKMTLAENVCETLKLGHVNADPSGQERMERGIRSRYDIATYLGISKEKISLRETEINKEAAPDDRKREGFWYEKLLPHISKRCLFICGYEHVEPFLQLLRFKGLPVKILKIIRSSPVDLG